MTVRDDGTLATPSPAFTAYRDGTASPADPRTAHMAGIFADLAEAGWATNNLYLAWDFTTASTRNVTGRLLHIRDDALGQLGQCLEDALGRSLLVWRQGRKHLAGVGGNESRYAAAFALATQVRDLRYEITGSLATAGHPTCTSRPRLQR